MTDRKRRQNLAKCCSVSLRSLMNQETTPKWTYKHKVWEKSPNYGLWNVVRVWFFLKIVVFVVQSGLKLYDPTVMAAGVQMNEFEIAPVRTTLTTEPSCVCLIELKTGLIIKLERWLQQFSGKIKHVPHFKAANWKIFSQNLWSYVHFWAVSLIHSALQRNAATLRKVLAPFSFSHVFDSCSLFISFLSLSFFLFLDFIVISDFVFIKTIILLGLTGYQIIITNSALRTLLVIYHLISSAPS